jgi:hypothetical protein
VLPVTAIATFATLRLSSCAAMFAGKDWGVIQPTVRSSYVLTKQLPMKLLTLNEIFPVPKGANSSQVWSKYVNPYWNKLPTEQCTLLAVHAVGGRLGSSNEVFAGHIKWSKLRDSSLCLLIEHIDGVDVQVPYAFLRIPAVCWIALRIDSKWASTEFYRVTVWHESSLRRSPVPRTAVAVVGDVRCLLLRGANQRIANAWARRDHAERTAAWCNNEPSMGRHFGKTCARESLQNCEQVWGIK